MNNDKDKDREAVVEMKKTSSPNDSLDSSSFDLNEAKEELEEENIFMNRLHLAAVNVDLLSRQPTVLGPRFFHERNLAPHQCSLYPQHNPMLVNLNETYDLPNKSDLPSPIENNMSSNSDKSFFNDSLIEQNESIESNN